jgi:hypothetical protein
MRTTSIIALLLAVLEGGLLATTGGYLAKIGPTALRFKLPPDPNAPEVRLPRLAPLIEIDTNLNARIATNLLKQSGAAPPAETVAISAGLEPTIDISTNQPTIQAASPASTNIFVTAPTSMGATLTPAILGSIFLQNSAGVTGNNPSIIVPAGFAPAVPPISTGQSSSATYSSPSPGAGP